MNVRVTVPSVFANAPFHAFENVLLIPPSEITLTVFEPLASTEYAAAGMTALFSLK